MGPTILLDKCALQSLTTSELHAVSRVFFVNVPPILIQEIAGDLAKRKVMKSPAHEVGTLARKLSACVGESFINCHYVHLSQAELLGQKIQMDGVSIVRAKTVPLHDGRKVSIISQHSDEDTLRRWCTEQITPEDRAFAEKLSAASKRVDLNAMVSQFQKDLGNLPKLKDLNAVASSVDIHLRNSEQATLLESVMDTLKIPPDVRVQVMSRWKSIGPSSLQIFAPYTFFVFRTIYLFTIGLGYGLLGTKATNQLDLEYLFYLPFCRVFSSGDNFLVQMSAILLRKGQYFLERDRLKEDMRALSRMRGVKPCNQGPVQEHYIRLQRFSHPSWQTFGLPWQRNEGPALPPEESKAMFLRFKKDMEELKAKGLM